MSGELILVVDDNEANVELVCDILDYHGFRTMAAATATEAIAAALANRPDVVLMDVQLPDFDGVSALQRLRDDPRTCTVPVVALTAFAMKDDAARYLHSGFDAYLAKPLDIKALPACVREYCRGAIA